MEKELQMKDAGKTFIKVYCSKSKCYGLVTAEEKNGTLLVTNFYGIDAETAKSIRTSAGSKLPPVAESLRACTSCGGRTPACCDKSGNCRVKGEMPFQCLYCSKIEVCRDAPAASSAAIYFLMDQSGSMGQSDRKRGANAVRRMVQSLQGNGNLYSFVAWGTNAGYIFRNESSLDKMNAALTSYELGKTGYGGGTAAHVALEFIRKDVQASKMPVRILLVTDGGFDSEAAAIRARNELLAGKQNVEILAIGVTGARQSTLEKIGTVPAFSKVVGGSSALTSTFEQIAEILKRNGNNF